MASSQRPSSSDVSDNALCCAGCRWAMSPISVALPTAFHCSITGRSDPDPTDAGRKRCGSMVVMCGRIMSTNIDPARWDRRQCATVGHVAACAACVRPPSSTAPHHQVSAAANSAHAAATSVKAATWLCGRLASLPVSVQPASAQAWPHTRPGQLAGGTQGFSKRRPASATISQNRWQWLGR